MDFDAEDITKVVNRRRPVKKVNIGTPEEVKEDIENFYKRFNLTKVKNKRNVENELLYQLFKKPKETVKIKLVDTSRDDVQQIDLLYLPNDKGFKYALVAVDVGSRLTDAAPLKGRTAKETLAAMKKIYKRKILNLPNQIVVDSGKEFQGEFASWFKQQGVRVFVSQPNRHRETGLVESRNKSIGDYIMRRQAAQELVTGETSREWIDDLPVLINELNERFERKDSAPNESNKIFCKGRTCDLLELGDLVRYPLDRPIDIATGKPTDRRFRSGDIRYSITPAKIRTIRTSPTNPPLYGLEGKKALYSREVLIPVKEEEIKLPPSSTQRIFEIEKLLNKKVIDGLIHFLVKWKNGDEPTWEPRRTLIREVPNLIKEYDNSLKKKSKKKVK